MRVSKKVGGERSRRQFVQRTPAATEEEETALSLALVVALVVHVRQTKANSQQESCSIRPKVACRSVERPAHYKSKTNSACNVQSTSDFSFAKTFSVYFHSRRCNFAQSLVSVNKIHNTYPLCNLNINISPNSNLFTSSNHNRINLHQIPVHILRPCLDQIC